MTAPLRRVERYYSASWHPGLGGGGTPPPTGPTITSLAPDRRPADSVVAVAVNGTGFVDGAVVVVDGVDQPSAYQSATQVNVPAFTWPTPGTVQFTVRNPDGTVSNAVPFTVQQPLPPRPVLDSIDPATLPVGATPVTLQFIGSLFEADIVAVRGGSVTEVTTFVSATECTIQYTPTATGTVSFQVRNGPSGPLSVVQSVEVTAAEEDTP